tara:strand:- start:314 stop:1759 length:1446 start_codon:yes stop_codon:yes gene_type:complete
MPLPISSIVNVQINVSPLAQQRAGFGLLNLVGVSDVISIGERYRLYNNITGVAADFAVTDEEYLAASTYFSQSPRPTELMISRRALTDASASLVCGLNAESDYKVWKLVTDGSLKITLDGGAEDVVGSLDFSAASSMAGVAAVIESGLAAGTCKWTGSRFIFKSGTTGVASTITVLTAGATGTDISVPAYTDGQAPVARIYDGIAAESMTAALTAINDVNSTFFGVAGTKEINDTQAAQDAAAWCEPLTKLFANSSSDANTVDPQSTSDVAYLFQQQGYNRTFSVFSRTEDYPAVSVFARGATVNFEGTNTTLTLKFKLLPGIAPDEFTATEVAAMEGKNCNYYTFFADSRMLSQGQLAVGRFIDEVWGLDWLQNAVEVDVFNLLYQSTTKIPQTDKGTALITATIERVLKQAVANGLGAPGTVTVGTDTIYLNKGFQVVAQAVADQSQADREARKAPAITFVLKGAGAIHSVDIIGTFER